MVRAPRKYRRVTCCDWYFIGESFCAGFYFGACGGQLWVFTLLDHSSIEITAFMSWSDRWEFGLW
jgi:hypothetical protein